MLIVQIKPSAAKTLTLRAPSVQDTLPSPGKRLSGILSPGLVPSMDYSISLRALDHTELYLDSQKESSNLQEGVHGCSPCHTQVPMSPPMGHTVRAAKCPNNPGAGWRGCQESPALSLWQWETLSCPSSLVQSPFPSSSFTIPLRNSHPTDEVQRLLLERSLMPKHHPSPALCRNPVLLLLPPSCWLCVAIFAQPTEQKYRELC